MIAFVEGGGGGGALVNTKHLYIIYTMLSQRRRRWADALYILYKCFVFTEAAMVGAVTHN